MAFRSDLHEARNDGLENVDGGTDQFETGTDPASDADLR